MLLNPYLLHDALIARVVAERVIDNMAPCEPGSSISQSVEPFFTELGTAQILPRGIDSIFVQGCRQIVHR